MILKRAGKFGISAVLGLLLLLPLFAESDEQEDEWGPKIGSDAPSISLEDTEGKKRTIDDLRGDKEAMLIFFCSSRSGFRDQLLSDMQEQFEQFTDSGFAIVAITNDEIEENKKSKKALNLEFPLLSDQNLEHAEKFDFVVLNPQNEERTIPGVVLIDADNKVKFKQRFETMRIHYDSFDGSSSNDYIHIPSIYEVLESLTKLSSESTLDQDSAIEE